MRALALLLLLVLAGCGAGSGAPSTSPGTAGASPTPGAPTAGPSATGLIELKGVDICAVLDESQVQTITGEAVRFATQGRSDASSAKCFWGAAVPGVPAYVEISVFRTRDGLASWNPSGPACAVTPVSGLGAEAKGAVCPGDPQKKVWLAVTDQNLIVTVLVNEPKGGLSPADLAGAFKAVWERLT